MKGFSDRLLATESNARELTEKRARERLLFYRQ